MRDLHQRTVLITRALEDARDWAERLESLGARVLIQPCVTFQLLNGESTRDRLRRALATADWLVLTSARAARSVARLLQPDARLSIPVAVVGPSTAREASRLLGRADLVARGPGSRALGRELLETLGDRGARSPRVLTAAAENGLRHLEETLEPAGIRVDRVAVYRTHPARSTGELQDLEQLGVDTILLASPSAVEGLVQTSRVPTHASIVTLGPTTSAAARSHGLWVAGQARRPDFECLLEAIP